MAEPPVANASPLILLSKGGCLDLLRVAGERILTPAAVVAEISGAAQTIRPSGPFIRQVGWAWLKTRRWPGRFWRGIWGRASRPCWLGQRPIPEAEAICDDLAAPPLRKALGIPVRGTVGIVLLAKRRGVIPAARPVIERMVRSGMYLSDRALERRFGCGRGIG